MGLWGSLASLLGLGPEDPGSKQFIYVFMWITGESPGSPILFTLINSA